MATGTPSPAPTSLRRNRVILRRGAVALSIVWLFSLVFYGWQTWQATERAAINNLTSVVELSERAMHAYFAGYDQSLGAWGRELVTPDGKLNVVAARDAVRRMHVRHPELTDVSFIDPVGQVLASSITTVESSLPSVATVPTYQAFMADLNGMTRFDIGRPTLSVISGQWIVPMRSVVRNADGRYLGFLVASTPVGILQSYWASAPIVSQAALGLLGDDGYLRARFPVFGSTTPEDVYNKPRSGTLIGHLRSQQFPSRGYVYGSTSVDRISALNVYDRMDPYPVTFFAVLPLTELWESWWLNFRAPLFMTLLLTVVGFITFRYVKSEQERGLQDQAELDRVSHELAAIFDTSQDAIISATPDGRCTAWNPAAERLLGYQSSEVMGFNLDFMVPVSLRYLVQQQIHQVLRGNTLPPQRTQRIHKLGHTVNVEVVSSRVLEAQGNVAGVSHVIRDITAQLQNEAELLASAAQVKDLSGRLLQAQEDERRRLALELHDDLGQTLTAIKINMVTRARVPPAQAETIEADTIRHIDHAIRGVRDMTVMLRPTMLDDLGLVPALQWLGEQVGSRTGLLIRVEDRTAGARLPKMQESTCYRIVQECLTNVQRHAQASSVEILVDLNDEGVVLEVRDDGVGFDVDAMLARARAGTSLGLLGMQERAQLSGGAVEWVTSPGQGCVVRMAIPAGLLHRSPEGNA